MTSTSAANALADDNPQCPFAKNLAAEAVKKIVDTYKDKNPLKYLVIVGNTNIISYFYHPDFADLAKESQFVPPVNDGSPSQAALKLDFVPSDDDYVAMEMVPLGNSSFPIVDPNFAVGRLVETPAAIITMLEAYDQTTGGVVPTPQSAFVSGYDFLRGGWPRPRR